MGGLKRTIQYIKADEDNMPMALQIIEFYHDSQVDTSEIGLVFKTHLSFAWEYSPNNEKLKTILAKNVEDTEIVVVIGYSFPFFNREMDRYIFSKMGKLKKVYIQDINPEAVKQSIQAVLPNEKKVFIEPIRDCGQFFSAKRIVV